MNNGIKIAVLGAIAVALTFVFFRLFSSENVVNANQQSPGPSETRALPNRVRAANGRWYKPDASGQPDMSKPVNTRGGAFNEIAGAASANRKKTKIIFDKTEHNFGVINEGDQMEYVFRFTNTGTEPLIIEDAHATCGCTVPVWPDKPVAPGNSGIIKVSYNSAGKQGAQSTDVAITANTTPVVTNLKIKANVLANPNGTVLPEGVVAY